MLKTVLRARIQVEEKLVSLQCNKCGRETPVENPDFLIDEAQEYSSFEASGSYSSKYPYDMTSIHFELCADCLKTFVESFAIPVETRGGVYQETLQAIHTETGEKLEILGSIAAVGEVPEGREWDDAHEALLLESERLPPVGAVYRHYKRETLYEVTGATVLHPSEEVLVLYRSLGEAEPHSWARPLESWLKPPTDGVGERFARVTL